MPQACATLPKTMIDAVQLRESHMARISGQTPVRTTVYGVRGWAQVLGYLKEGFGPWKGPTGYMKKGREAAAFVT